MSAGAILRPVPCPDCASFDGHAVECGLTTRMVKYTGIATSDQIAVHSKVVITVTTTMPAGSGFSGVDATEVVECGYCCALVPKEREYRHELWHQDMDRAAGR